MPPSPFPDSALTFDRPAAGETIPQKHNSHLINNHNLQLLRCVREPGRRAGVHDPEGPRAAPEQAAPAGRPDEEGVFASICFVCPAVGVCERVLDPIAHAIAAPASSPTFPPGGSVAKWPTACTDLRLEFAWRAAYRGQMK